MDEPAKVGGQLAGLVSTHHSIGVLHQLARGAAAPSFSLMCAWYDSTVLTLRCSSRRSGGCRGRRRSAGTPRARDRSGSASGESPAAGARHGIWPQQPARHPVAHVDLAGEDPAQRHQHLLGRLLLHDVAVGARRAAPARRRATRRASRGSARQRRLAGAELLDSSSPSGPWSDMSTTTTSGLSASIAVERGGGLLGLAADVRSGSWLMSSARPCRTIGWSSTTKTRCLLDRRSVAVIGSRVTAWKRARHDRAAAAVPRRSRACRRSCWRDSS